MTSNDEFGLVAELLQHAPLELLHPLCRWFNHGMETGCGLIQNGHLRVLDEAFHGLSLHACSKPLAQYQVRRPSCTQLYRHRTQDSLHPCSWHHLSAPRPRFKGPAVDCPIRHLYISIRLRCNISPVARGHKLIGTRAEALDLFRQLLSPPTPVFACLPSGLDIGIDIFP